MAEERWHLVEAKRDDGDAVMFRIRELEPDPTLARIFVVELPFETTEMSKLPSATAYRRLQAFEEQWLVPAAHALGWQFVGVRTEDGSYFLYLYGNGEPHDMIARLSPFDAALGFYDEDDPTWREYATLRGLLDEAKSKPPETTRMKSKPKKKR